MSDFQERLKAAQLAQDAAKHMTGEQAEKPPKGVYIGKLTDMRGMVSKKGSPMILTEITITEGDFRGMKALDFVGLEHDFLIARARARIQQLGYTAPEVLIDMEASARQGEFILAKDLLDTCNAIGEEEQEVRFNWVDEPYSEIKIIEVLGEAGAGDEQVEEKVEPAEESSSGDDDAANPDLLALAISSGIEVTDGMSQSELVAMLNDYQWWETRCAKSTLVEAGITQDPKDGVDPEAAALLRAAGIDVLAPSAAKVSPPKAVAKAVAKAPEKSLAKKRK